MARRVTPIPVPVILAAVNGDEEALVAVVAHYQDYIRALATRPAKDAYGNEYLCVDEDMRLRADEYVLSCTEPYGRCAMTSSEQAAHLSLPCKHESSIVTLLLLSPKSL